jgi:hypothetical protein
MHHANAGNEMNDTNQTKYSPVELGVFCRRGFRKEMRSAFAICDEAISSAAYNGS